MASRPAVERRRGELAAAWKIAACLGAACLGAAAAPAAADSTRAETLFRQGRELMAAGKLAEACAAFDASQKLEPATTTLFNQADCREKHGDLATAWGLFVAAQRETRDAGDEVGARMHAVAVERAARLEPLLSKLTVRVARPVAGLVVMRGDVVIEPGEWNQAIPIDGGSYTFRARIGARDVWSATLVVGPQSDIRTVEVVVPAAAPVQPPAPTAARSRWLAPVPAAIAGGALLGGALAFELWGGSTYARAKERHDEALRRSANHKRYAAEALAVAGAGCAGLAAWLWYRDHREARDRAAPRTAVTPVAGAGFTGLVLDGSW